VHGVAGLRNCKDEVATERERVEENTALVQPQQLNFESCDVFENG
jgi:hypothetical protein